MTPAAAPPPPTPTDAPRTPLVAPLVVEFPFTRSLGPVQSAFLTGLRESTVLGVRTEDGRVLVPPVEYDPATAAELRDLVEVAATGTVTTWAWNPAPRRDQPLTTPFAWALVRLDGADTALLHALDAPGPDAVHSGMRVRIRWAATRTGAITDIACFEPYDGPRQPTGADHTGTFDDPVTGIVAPARLDYSYAPGRAQSRYLDALAERRMVGERCPRCRKVYVPPRGACPTCGIATTDPVEVGPRGTVTTFCIVNIKAKNLDIEVPYVYAHIALDGADLALHGRIGGIPYDEVRMGLRVEPVWPDDPDGRYPDHYRPTGEPDADYDAYKELL
ncbi:OB-fold domain-containing protein [Streptomyces sp. NPDC047315]|uniref:Zn-ribbon domain-containing OB-fold protein n=1 Tax=Streptomyces sp. NPDC047315 TaxID=3155142 RepID=UPI00340AFFA5